ncbi:16S rRNA (cytosine(1402)-N(4))-methyltransferase RsmH [Candidatus Gottesmanbacteria bacterium]|nr:16S rRNA (cytosine(1402)-N(4))-methyltransferase RsmH [Candidatus Gottesmanbacteria bacterium]
MRTRVNNYHIPVLVNEIVHYLQVKEGNKYIDATLGGGGHTRAILDKGGIVLGIDQDQDAIEYTKKELGKIYKDKLIIEKGNFSQMKKIAQKNNFIPQGILFDLGVSSYQIDNPDRGFSFNKDATLDMRMDKSSDFNALDIVNRYQYQDLVRILQKFGEEHLAGPIASDIVTKRKTAEITTTSQLSEIVFDVYRKHGQKVKHNQSTKVFQAIRMEVNSELNNLKFGLEQAIDLLSKDGRLAVLSYHSLEDRIIKLNIKNKKLKIITRKPVLPSEQEIKTNPRSRSAKLRVAQKL